MIPLFSPLEIHGDGTRDYEVKFNTPTTVRQLLKFCKNQKEWGTITVSFNNLVSCKIEYNFKGGNDCYNIMKKVPESVMRVKITEGSSCGGWGLMNYEVSVTK